MPAHSDHVRRDAEHAARSEVAIVLSKYVRRLNEEAKAHIAQKLAAGQVTDGTQLGRDAAQAAVSSYLGLDDAQPAIDA